MPGTSSRTQVKTVRLANADWLELELAAEQHGWTVNDEIKWRVRSLRSFPSDALPPTPVPPRR